MTQPINLLEIERKAFRSMYQDGFWDIYIAFVAIGVSIMSGELESDAFPWPRFVIALACIGVGYLIYWAGKKYITQPRLGRVQFGENRQKRKRTMGIVLGVLVAVQLVVFLLSVGVWAIPSWGAGINQLFPGTGQMDLLVAAIGALFVGVGTLLVAYFRDFPRGYYIAVVLMVCVFLMIWQAQPIWTLVAAVLIGIPGVYLLVRFLQRYPTITGDPQ